MVRSEIGHCNGYGSGCIVLTNAMAAKKNSATDEETSRANRITLPLTQENEIDWESVRPSIKEKFLSIVNNDVTTLEHVGMAHESGGSGTGPEGGETSLPEITEENVRTALDILTRTNALAFRMLAPKLIAHPVRSQMAGRRVPMQLDIDITLASFKLTKEQHEELDPRALRLAKKYIPAEANKHLDIILLAGMFLKFQVDNGMKALEFQLKRDMSRGQPTSSIPQPPVDSDKTTQPVNGRERVSNKSPEPEQPAGDSLEPGMEPGV